MAPVDATVMAGSICYQSIVFQLQRGEGGLEAAGVVPADNCTPRERFSTRATQGRQRQQD